MDTFYIDTTEQGDSYNEAIYYVLVLKLKLQLLKSIMVLGHTLRHCPKRLVE